MMDNNTKELLMHAISYLAIVPILLLMTSRLFDILDRDRYQQGKK